MKFFVFLLLMLATSCTERNDSGPLRVVYSTAEDRTQKDLARGEQFRLIDQFSEAHALSEYTNFETLFLVATQKDCFGGREHELVTAARGKKDSPVLLVAGTARESFRDYQSVETRVLFDHWHFLSRRYSLSTAGDFVEIRTDNGAVVRRGHAGGHHCAIYSGPPPEPNFSRDVLPIFAKACLGCHMKFPAIDYFESMKALQGWSKMIARTMEVYRMPPGGADPDYGPLQEVFTADSLADLYHWAAAGAKFTQKDEESLAKRRQSPVKKNPPPWLQEDPVYTFEMKSAHKIPASGAAYYDNAQIAGPMPEDIWVQGVEFSHNLAVLHHSNLMVSTKPLKEVTKKIAVDWRWNFTEDQDVSRRPLKVTLTAGGKPVGGKVVDEIAVFSMSRTQGKYGLGKGVGALIPKGSYLIVDNHYQPSGEADQNISKISLYKYRSETPPKQLRHWFIRPVPFTIPAKERRYKVEAVIPMERDITLFGYTAHMHFRGKSSKLYVTRPGHEKKLLISIPYFQLKFERQWNLQTPLYIEKGSVLTVETVYDNSEQNIANPNPNVKVKYGESTYANEMHSMRIFYFDEGI